MHLRVRNEQIAKKNQEVAEAEKRQLASKDRERADYIARLRTQTAQNWASRQASRAAAREGNRAAMRAGKVVCWSLTALTGRPPSLQALMASLEKTFPDERRLMDDVGACIDGIEGSLHALLQHEVQQALTQALEPEVDGADALEAALAPPRAALAACHQLVGLLEVVPTSPSRGRSWQKRSMVS